MVRTSSTMMHGTAPRARSAGRLRTTRIEPRTLLALSPRSRPFCPPANAPGTPGHPDFPQGVLAADAVEAAAAEGFGQQQMDGAESRVSGTRRCCWAPAPARCPRSPASGGGDRPSQGVRQNSPELPLSVAFEGQDRLRQFLAVDARPPRPEGGSEPSVSIRARARRTRPGTDAGSGAGPAAHSRRRWPCPPCRSRRTRRAAPAPAPRPPPPSTGPPPSAAAAGVRCGAWHVQAGCGTRSGSLGAPPDGCRTLGLHAASLPGAGRPGWKSPPRRCGKLPERVSPGTRDPWVPSAAGTSHFPAAGKCRPRTGRRSPRVRSRR